MQCKNNFQLFFAGWYGGNRCKRFCERGSVPSGLVSSEIGSNRSKDCAKEEPKRQSQSDAKPPREPKIVQPESSEKTNCQPDCEPQGIGRPRIFVLDVSPY